MRHRTAGGVGQRRRALRHDITRTLRPGQSRKGLGRLLGPDVDSIRARDRVRRTGDGEEDLELTLRSWVRQLKLGVRSREAVLTRKDDLDFTDGTIHPAEPSRDATRDQQCLGPTSAANIARCEELCEEFGGTHDPGWGNIGGCRDMPASSGDLDFTDGTIRPEEPDS